MPHKTQEKERAEAYELDLVDGHCNTWDQLRYDGRNDPVASVEREDAAEVK